MRVMMLRLGIYKLKEPGYVPDSLVIRMELGDDRYDENRIANNAPRCLVLSPVYWELSLCNTVWLA